MTFDRVSISVRGKDIRIGDRFLGYDIVDILKLTSKKIRVIYIVDGQRRGVDVERNDVFQVWRER
jgi:hypothetical protein